MGKSFVIGIAGGSGSGKTTLAQALADSLKDLSPRILHMDSYFHRFGTGQLPRHTAPLSGVEYEDHNHPASFDLARLYADIDGAADSATVLIIEGLLVLYDEQVRSRLDMRLFVDTSADERMYRRITRFASHGQKLEDAARYYLESVRFRHAEFVEPSRWQADLVINSCRPFAPAVAIVTSYVRHQLSSGRSGNIAGH